MPPVAIEEPVGQEVERRAEMRAGIDVSIKRVVLAHHEHGAKLGADAEAETARAARRHLVDAAEALRRHGVTPPILHRSRHSSGPTGDTERRPCFTKGSAPSFGSALMAASVTGVFTGERGAKSTMTNFPVLSPGSGYASLVISTMPTIAGPSPE